MFLFVTFCNFFKKNDWFLIYKSRNNYEEEQKQHLKRDTDALIELKSKRVLEIMFKSLFKESLVYSSFLLCLYYVTFSNLSKSSLQYNKLFYGTFVQSQSLSERGLYEVNKFYLFFNYRIEKNLIE